MIFTESSDWIPQSGWVTTTFQRPDWVTVIDCVVKVGCKTPFQYHLYSKVAWFAGGFSKLQCKVYEVITELQIETVLIAGGSGKVVAAVGPKLTPQTGAQSDSVAPALAGLFVCSKTNWAGKPEKLAMKSKKYSSGCALIVNVSVDAAS